MSDYIITCDDEVAGWVGNDVESMRPLVRCRDCLWSKPEQSDHEYRAERHCNMWISDVSADGFCFRGKLRGEGESE